jgi:hypothetical protein
MPLYGLWEAKGPDFFRKEPWERRAQVRHNPGMGLVGPRGRSSKKSRVREKFLLKNSLIHPIL